MDFVKYFFCSCKTISLGQSQGAIAEKLLSEAVASGNWIVFENCHIATDWMVKLESLYSNLLKSKEVNDEFRWWFVLTPTTSFPLIFLRDAIKVVIEPPSNLRENMMKQYSTEPLINEKFFASAFTPPLSVAWYRFVFAFNALHTVCVERIPLGSIGWSKPYDFNDSVRKLLLFQLRTFVKQTGSIPYENFFYLANDCNYGNEIVDPCDRRLLEYLLKQFCNEIVTTNDGYRFFETSNLCIPSEPNRENCIEYLKSLPFERAPCELGLNNNIEHLQKSSDGQSVS